MKTIGLVAACVLAVGGVSAQCSVAVSDATQKFAPVFGGESRGSCSFGSGASTTLLVAEDGGRIRRSTDNGASWAYVETPGSHTHTLFDIEMVPGSLTEGFACGRGGTILHTANGGATWTSWCPTVTDPCGDPASLWSVEPLSSSVVLISGLWLFQFTSNGGQTWGDLGIYEFYDDVAGTVSNQIVQDEFHVYGIDVVGDLQNGWVGIACAEYEVAAGSIGVVFHTDSRVGAASLGRKWWFAMTDAPEPVTGKAMAEPWAVAYERTATDLDNAVGYVVGGRKHENNATTTLFRTKSGGKSWDVDFDDIPATLYQVAAEAGEAIAVGYNGQCYARQPNGTWATRVIPSSTPHVAGALQFIAPITALNSNGQGAYYFGGSAGFSRGTDDYGVTFFSTSGIHDQDEQLFRYRGMDFVDANQGVVVGQGGSIRRTLDGGCSWTAPDFASGSFSGPSLHQVSFRDANVGVAVGEGVIYLSGDGGASWGSVVTYDLMSNLIDISGYRLNDVQHAGTSEWWAVGYDGDGADAVVLYSRNNGGAWHELGGFSPADAANLTLEAVTLPARNEVIVVGWRKVQGMPAESKAFVTTFTGGPQGLTWQDVSPSVASSARKFFDVASTGSSLAAGRVVAVGTRGQVMELVTNPTLQTFEQIGAAPVLVTDCQAVGFSPNGDEILVGTQYDEDLTKSADLGWGLREFNGSWSRIRQSHGKDSRAIRFVAEGHAFVLAAPTSGTTTRMDDCLGYAYDPPSTSFDQGNIADSVILEYVQ